MEKHPSILCVQLQEKVERQRALLVLAVIVFIVAGIAGYFAHELVVSGLEHQLDQLKHQRTGVYRVEPS